MSIQMSSVPPHEIVLFILFVLYVVFPMDMPMPIASVIDSALGMVGLFAIAVYMFVYGNPVLGVLFLFVAYELVRRSANTTARTAIIQYTPSQTKKDAVLTSLNAPLEEKTLEEEMVDIRAPIGKTSPAEYLESEFKPVTDKLIAGASMV